MIDIKTIGVWGFEGAIRGMRMPYESFDKSDSGLLRDILQENDECLFNEKGWCDDCPDCHYCHYFGIGRTDMALCKKLIKGGSEHRKFMRMIHVQADVKAPRYWWVQTSKYKWVEDNSSSTMHRITKRELTIDDFSHDPEYNEIDSRWLWGSIDRVNDCIREYNLHSEKETKDYWFRKIKQFLPESYNQLRTIDTNYECLLNIYRQRKNHRLSEWHTFCYWIESLPYMKEFLGEA